jgi:Mitochondrial fission regulator
MTTATLAHFANFKLAGDRLVRDAITSIQGDPNRNANSSPISAFFGDGGYGGAGSGSRMRYANGTTARSRRRRRGGRGAQVGAMSDTDLEAELAVRRASRARERQRYARAMRSEKLAALEDELIRLRGEIAKIDPGITRRVAGIGPASSGSSHVTWDTLPGEEAGSGAAGVLPAAPGGGRGPPPPPGPPPPLVGAGDDEEGGAIDPEKQRREKADRQRRREEKRKQREAAKKPMTLAEIIRSAGPDPMKLLKKRSEKSSEAEAEAAVVWNSFATLKESLKKTGDNDASSDAKTDDKDAASDAMTGENAEEAYNVVASASNEVAAETADATTPSAAAGESTSDTPDGTTQVTSYISAANTAGNPDAELGDSAKVVAQDPASDATANPSQTSPAAPSHAPIVSDPAPLKPSASAPAELGAEISAPAALSTPSAPNKAQGAAVADVSKPSVALPAAVRAPLPEPAAIAPSNTGGGELTASTSTVEAPESSPAAAIAPLSALSFKLAAASDAAASSLGAGIPSPIRVPASAKPARKRTLAEKRQLRRASKNITDEEAGSLDSAEAGMEKARDALKMD